MKKKITIIALITLIFGGALFFFLKKDKNSADAPTINKKKISQPINIVPVADRPYITLAPTSDGHNIIITVEELKNDAIDLNYEMEYQTGSMLQGFQGLISLAKIPVSEKKLFGSRSAGGAVTYHEDIRGGNLLAELNAKEDYAVKSAWRYFTNSDNETEFSSQDAKFSISNIALKNYSYIVIYNSPGYPENLKTNLLSEPYVVRAEKSLKTISSNFDVSIRTTEETAIIMGYDGAEWIEMETKVINDVAKASGIFMDAYILVKK